MTTIKLTEDEARQLQKELYTSNRGGFSEFCRALCARLGKDLTLTLTAEECWKIERHATKYGEGGWNARMYRIFARTLKSTWGKPGEVQEALL